MALLIAAGCSQTPPTNEDLALQACNASLRERLDVADDELVVQTQMIGKRDFGWLVRGLTVEVPEVGARNYECRLADAPAGGPPALTHVRLCDAGDSPWGCPGGDTDGS